jgi:hypothetical protein|tara:strand:+ start:142 stop:297 length:156 start_codon:yes stop_codon:yes gene_type:complete
MTEEVFWKAYVDRRGNWRVTTNDREIPNNSLVKEFVSKQKALDFLEEGHKK